MKRLLVPALVALCVAVLSTSSESRGEGGKPLTSEQAAAKEVFLEGVSESLSAARAKCGPGFQLVTDFENYQEETWMALESGSERVKRLKAQGSVSGACAAVLSVAARSCVKSQDTGAPAIEVKGASCLFSGAQPQQASDDPEDVIRRNLTFAGGLVTLRHVPGFKSTVDETAWSVIHGFAKSSGRKNGAACSGGAQCRSFLCRSGSCQACSDRAPCGDGAVCEAGRCLATRAPASDEPSSTTPSASSASSKPKGSERGRMCGKGSDCRSGKCKMENRTRGRCQ